MTKQLMLASASPRRKALLQQQVGVEFEVRPVDMDESMRAGEGVLKHVQRLALEKARLGYTQAALQANDLAVLAADTVVEVDGEVLGKPENAGQAAAFLARLSGKKHKVHTAVAIVTANRELSALSSSEVEFAQLTGSQINAYVATGEPMDKAGAYAIQGLAARFVVNLNGSYSGVMGLPVYETANLLSACGVRSRI
ncbi:MAG: Maf family protein [Gammaproteobacteria bacterium]|jgi:septum formation protein